MIRSIAAASLLLSIGAVSAQENYSTSWSQHKYVIINTALAGTATAQVNFPVLVRLGAADSAIFNGAKSDGSDIRFTKTDDATRLAHEIESWNAAAKTAAIWVRVDTLLPAKNNNAIRIHWGNASAADSSNGAQVFRTADNFQAVWHMNGTTNESDATANGFTATQNGTVPSAPGAIGAGRVVSSGNYFWVGGTANSVLNFPEGSSYSVSAWVYTSAMPGNGTIVSKHDRAWALKLNGEASSWEFFEFGSDLTVAGWNYVNAPTFDDYGVWRHIVGFRSEDGSLGMYWDGVRIDGFSTAGSSSARVTNTDVAIGAQPNGTSSVNRPFDGTLDEIRLSTSARSDDWVKLEFENQKANSQVVTLSNTVPASIARPAARGQGFSVKSSGEGLQFRFTPGAAVRAQISVSDMSGRVVWARSADARTGTLAWNGRAASGALAPQGVYAVRIRLIDASGSALRTLESRVPLTR